jgi:hypothetical protein
MGLSLCFLLGKSLERWRKYLPLVGEDWCLLVVSEDKHIHQELGFGRMLLNHASLSCVSTKKETHLPLLPLSSAESYF